MNRIVLLVILFFDSLLLFASADSVQITGVVLDAETREPIEGVRIFFGNNLPDLITNSKGEFKFFYKPNSSINLNAARIGYKQYSKQCLISGDSCINSEILLIPEEIILQEIIVDAKDNDSKFTELTQAHSVLKARDLQQNLNQTLASTLKNEVGIAVRSMGPALARPVIKGLGSNRIILAQDGILSNDLSSTSPDHAVSIEPYSAEKIEILRGPKIVLYSTSLAGGVINVSKNDVFMNQIGKEQFSAGLFLNSANLGRQGNFQAAAPIGKFTIWSMGGLNKTDNIRSPEKTLANTGSDNLTYSIGTSYNILDLSAAGFYESFKLDYGVPGGFLGSHPNGSDIEIEKDDYNFRLKYHFHLDLLDNIDVLFQRSYYHHTEYESNGSVGAEFVNRMLYSKVIFNQKELRLKGSKLFGSYGLEINYNDRKTGGFVFTPPASAISIAPFIFEDLSIGEYFLQAGIRISYDKYLPEIISTTKNPHLVKDRSFLNIGAGFSVMKEVFNRNYLGINLYHTEKAPTVEELYSEGPHLAAYSYEIGNSSLSKESGNGVELYYYYKSESDYFMASVFYNYFDSFIISRNSGEINYSILLPVYKTSSVDAEIYGFDAAYIKNISSFKIEGNLSAVYGNLLPSKDNLPMIPPLKGKIEVSYRKNRFTSALSSIFAAAQNRTDTFEEMTNGYIIFGISGGISFEFWNTFHILSLSIDNIFNSVYYNHLSRIKSIMPEPGRNIILRYKFLY